MIELEFTHSPDNEIIGKYKIFKQKITIGTLKDNIIIINDDKIKKLHLVFEVTAHGLAIYDYQRCYYLSNGKKISGKKLHQQNDTIKIGDTQFKILNFQFSLPAGQYLLEFSMLPASLYGQQFASFSYEPVEVSVKESIDTITIPVEADCALFLVDDSMHQLDNGVHMIKRHSYSEGYFTSYPLEKDESTGLYYAYFNPDPISSDPSAFLWFYNGRPDTAEGGLSTCDLEPGYQYYIKILD